MNDEEALMVLKETLENAKKATESHPPFFYGILLNVGDDLLRMSQHFQNDNFRACILFFRLDITPIWKAYLDPAFQSAVFEKLKIPSEEVEDIRKEVILNIASRFLSISVLSDDQGRDVVNTDELMGLFSESLAGFDEQTKYFAVLTVANAIREVYDTSFVEDIKNEIVEFYDMLIESSRGDWDGVHKVLREFVIKWDKKAVLWRRERV